MEKWQSARRSLWGPLAVWSCTMTSFSRADKIAPLEEGMTDCAGSILTTNMSSVDCYRDQKMQTRTTYWLVHSTLNIISSSQSSMGQHQDPEYRLEVSAAAQWEGTLWTAQFKTVYWNSRSYCSLYLHSKKFDSPQRCVCPSRFQNEDLAINAFPP